MSFYIKAATIGSRFIAKHKLLKYGFNLSPMYRRSTARVTEVSVDLMSIKIKLPISYKNINYMGTIFGGSMFAAVDPIPMTQLVQLLGDGYVVWDKGANISFKRPARENLNAHFTFSKDELLEIKSRVATENEIEIIKTTQLMNSDESTVFCQVDKTIYVAKKDFYKEKRKRKQEDASS
jgi:acyl-coenzyme A thioesterase PaaI-like protein